MENGKYVIAEREEAPSQVVEPVNAPKNEIQEVKVEAEQTKEPVKEVAPQGEKLVAASGYNVLPVEPVEKSGENRTETAESTPQIPENRTNPTEINGAVDMSTMQPVMGKDAFNELLRSGGKEEVNAYLKEIDHALRIGDNAPLDGKKVIQDDYRKAVEQYGKENIPAEVMTELNARIEPYARLERELFDRKYALQDSMLSLKVAMEEVLGIKDLYIEDVVGFENAYLGENRLSSVNKAENKILYR